MNDTKKENKTKERTKQRNTERNKARQKQTTTETKQQKKNERKKEVNKPDLVYRNIFQFYRQEVRKKGADKCLCRTAQAHPARPFHAQPC